MHPGSTGAELCGISSVIFKYFWFLHPQIGRHVTRDRHGALNRRSKGEVAPILQARNLSGNILVMAPVCHVNLLIPPALSPGGNRRIRDSWTPLCLRL